MFYNYCVLCLQDLTVKISYPCVHLIPVLYLRSAIPTACPPTAVNVLQVEPGIAVRILVSPCVTIRPVPVSIHYLIQNVSAESNVSRYSKSRLCGVLSIPFSHSRGTSKPYNIRHLAVTQALSKTS